MGTPRDKTWDRRSVLEWLGKGAVIGLGSCWLKSCGAPGSAVADGGDADRTGDAAGGPSQGSEDPEGACESGRFGFSPGAEDQGVFENWNVRTVDGQDLEAILDRWRLVVDGMVEHPATFSFAELIALPRQDQVTDFHCVEGWSVLDVPWNGVHVATMVDRVRPKASATHVNFHTFEGVYNESLPIAVALEPRTLLAYGVACNTLPLSRGFPLRLVVPRKWAYKSAKYVHRIEFTDTPILGYWERFGYPGEGDVPADRLRPGKY